MNLPMASQTQHSAHSKSFQFILTFIHKQLGQYEHVPFQWKV